MPAISSIFLVLSLVLAVVIGPQTRPWTWGPAMMALAISVLAGLPSIWKRGRTQADIVLLSLGAITAAWFAWRASVSPVPELGQADLLLLCSVVGAFVSTRAISGNPTAERILGWGITLLLLANVLVIGKQLIDPTFTPVFRARATEKMPSGFFAHYNEAANYLIASTMLVAASAWFGRHSTPTRILWALIAIAGLAGVWFTRSRGGIFGAAVACGVFFAIALIIGKRRGAKWFAPVLIAVPIIGIAISAFLFIGWHDAQEIRSAGSGFEGMMDNNARLYLYGIALSCIALHPLAGGGSQSFGWECFRFVDGKAQGDVLTHKPEFIHNELLQSATDYGLLGTTLLAAFIGTLILGTILRTTFEERPRDAGFSDAWRVGAFAAFAGMFVQSCFSFVFHLLPGILLLGICLGQMSRTRPSEASAKTVAVRLLVSIPALLCAVLLIPQSWKGTQVTRILWPTYFSKTASTSSESRIDALTRAIAVWPQSTFYLDRATIFQKLAASDDSPNPTEYAEQAISDYQEVSLLNPFDPAALVNEANILSQLHRDSEAEAAFSKAIALQGGMEPAFRARFSLANHFLGKGIRLFDGENPEPSHKALELAATQIETAVDEMHWLVPDMSEPRIAIHESLGTSRETVGDDDGALESYNFAASLPGGLRAHYRAGVLVGRLAVEAWAERKSSEALKGFTEALRRIHQSNGNMPEGVTPSQRLEYIDYLERTIAFLKGAKIEPAN